MVICQHSRHSFLLIYEHLVIYKHQCYYFPLLYKALVVCVNFMQWDQNVHQKIEGARARKRFSTVAAARFVHQKQFYI